MRPIYALMASAMLALPLTAPAQDARADANPADQAQSPTQTQTPARPAAELDPKVREKKFDLGRKGLALEGYDPVTYWPEGGTDAKPEKGSKKITYEFKGVTYRFMTQENLDRFKADPDKYEPAFGGWCAYAMAKGEYTEPDPKRFTVHNGRVYLFYDGLFGDTYKMWFDEGPDTLDPQAIEFWEKELDKEAEKQAAH